jgi:hypothetical protein
MGSPGLLTGGAATPVNTRSRCWPTGKRSPSTATGGAAGTGQHLLPILAHRLGLPTTATGGAAANTRSRCWPTGRGSPATASGRAVADHRRRGRRPTSDPDTGPPAGVTHHGDRRRPGGQLQITGGAAGGGKHPIPILAHRLGLPTTAATWADSCRSPAARRALANTDSRCGPPAEGYSPRRPGGQLQITGSAAGTGQHRLPMRPTG